MTNPAPHWNQADWDQLRLGETLMPGVWRVQGSADRRVEIKARKGQDGAVIQDQGYENAKLTLVGQLVSKADHDALEAALRSIHPRRKGAARDPVPIVHPAATLLGVDAVYVTSISTAELDNGILTQTIDVIEFIPAPKPKPKRRMYVAPPDLREGLVTLTDVSRSMRNSVYTSESGVLHRHLGVERPSEDVDWAAKQQNEAFLSDLAEQLGVEPTP